MQTLNKPSSLRAPCGTRCRCGVCTGASVRPRKAAANARPIVRPLAAYGNGNSFTGSTALSTVPRQLHQAVRPLPQDPVNLPAKGYLTGRFAKVLEHFPSALGVDDFIARVEVALCYFGFSGDNTIAVTNLCRDEVTAILKDKIEAVWGGSFNVNGLGGVLTCGVTGFKAGLSHAPVCAASGRERYVFFSFPHIAIDESGEVGAIARPGRPKKSCACGALAKCLKELKDEGLSSSFRIPGVHDEDDPEYSILKQRIINKMKDEHVDPQYMSLADITKVAERAISADLEKLISQAVDPAKADYAVVTGVQVHNWASTLENGSKSLEFVAPKDVYAVVNGVATHLDLQQIPQVTPRMLNLIANASMGGGAHTADDAATSYTGGSVSTLQEIPASYLFQRLISRPKTSFLTATANSTNGNGAGYH